MNNQKIKDMPTVWMNVTTSANWTRPPVGIVRVEQELTKNLENLLPKGQFARCIWRNGKFIAWDASYKQQLGFEWNEFGAPPKMATFDLSFKNLFKKKKKISSNDSAVENSQTTIDDTTDNIFKKGDILISVGLDWDQSYTESFFDLREKNGVRVVTCCYDLIPVLFPQYCVGDVSNRFKEYFNKLTWGSEAVLCISKQTQKDFLQLCRQIGAPIRSTKIMPLGDNIAQIIDNDISNEIEKICSEKFILFVSTIERRKNHEILYRAYHLLCRQGYKEILPKLVFVGMAGWGVGDLLKDIELDPETSDMILQLNHVTDSELAYLYKNAYFCAYPSLYEGWGLPVGEALASGKAVLASDRGSLPEVGGDLVHYLDPWDAQAWADKILEWSKNPKKIAEVEKEVVSKYKARQWSDCANSVYELILEILKTNDSKEIVLYPGYDCSTQVGVHMGSCLQSIGKDGFLMYGPHMYLEKGTYHVEIFDIYNNRISGLFNIDCAAKKGQHVYFSKSISLDELGSDRLIDFQVTLDESVDDFEIRCVVDEEIRITLSKIVISKIG